MKLASAILFILTIPLDLNAQSELERWVLTPELRIGSLDSPNYTLTEVEALQVAPDGTIYVGQDMDNVVRVFSDDGQFIRTIGGEGFGPGEFQSITAMGWHADSLWIVDFRQARVSLFNSAGEHLHTFGFRGPMLPISSRPTRAKALFADGMVLGEPLIGSQDVDILPLLRMSRSGEVFDTLALLSNRGEFANIRSRQLSMQVPLPISSNSIWDISEIDSTLIVVHRPIPKDGDRGYFRVQKIRSATDTIFDRFYAYIPKRVPKGSFDLVEQYQSTIDWVAERMDPSIAEDFLRDSVSVPEFQAPITAVVAGRDGTIWLRRDGGLQGPTVQWVALDPTGTLLASVSAPVKFDLLEAQLDTMWGVIEDELEVPYVMRYAVKPADPEAGSP